jgi:uncharacterized DUF497 family protein
MPWLDVIWTDENEKHVADAGLSRADVEHVIRNPLETAMSRSSGRPIAIGYTPRGRRIAAVYEHIDEITVYPITAYPVED